MAGIAGSRAFVDLLSEPRNRRQLSKMLMEVVV